MCGSDSRSKPEQTREAFSRICNDCIGALGGIKESVSRYNFAQNNEERLRSELTSEVLKILNSNSSGKESIGVFPTVFMREIKKFGMNGKVLSIDIGIFIFQFAKNLKNTFFSSGKAEGITFSENDFYHIFCEMICKLVFNANYPNAVDPFKVDPSRTYFIESEDSERLYLRNVRFTDAPDLKEKTFSANLRKDRDSESKGLDCKFMFKDSFHLYALYKFECKISNIGISPVVELSIQLEKESPNLSLQKPSLGQKLVLLNTFLNAVLSKKSISDTMCRIC